VVVAPSEDKDDKVVDSVVKKRGRPKKEELIA
jgi:hypothetical protein